MYKPDVSNMVLEKKKKSKLNFFFTFFKYICIFCLKAQ